MSVLSSFEKRVPDYVPSVSLPDWRYKLGFFATFTLLFLHPFWGNARVPAAILMILGLAWWVIDKHVRQDASQHRWVLLMACVAIPVFASWPGSFDSGETLEHVVLMVGMVFMGSALIAVLQQPGAPDLIKWLFAGLLILWVFDGLLQMFLGRDLLWLPQRLTTHGSRVVGMYGHHLYLSWVLLLLLPLTLWGLMQKRPYLALMILLATGVVIMGTGLRAAFLSWLIVSAAFLWHLKLPRKSMIVVGLVALLGAAVALSPIAQRKLADTKLDSLTFEQVDKLLNGRGYIWETGWLMFRDNLVTGVGSGAYSAAYNTYSYRPNDIFGPNSGREPPYHAHQMYVAILAERGMLGGIGILFAWLLLLRWYFKAAPLVRERARPFAISLFAVAFPINTQPPMLKMWWVPLFVFIVAALLSALSDQEDA